MKKPSISILTPVRNGMPYIKTCIESVMSQDFQYWELIVSDNGSTDETLDYLDSLTDPRIHIFKQPQNLGIMGNVNFVFKQSKAPFCQILCADDYFVDSRALRTIIKFWENAPKETGFATCNAAIPSANQIINLEHKSLPAKLSAGQADIWFLIFGNFCGNLSAMSLRTKLVHNGHQFNTELSAAGDFDFWSRTARITGMAILRDDLIHVRQHEHAATHYMGLKGEIYLQHLRIYEQIIAALATTYKQKELVDYFNYEVCSFHYRVATRSAFSGSTAYFNTIFSSRSPILWPLWKRLYLLPFSLLNRHQRLTYPRAKALLNEIYKTRKYESSNTSRGLWLQDQ